MPDRSSLAIGPIQPNDWPFLAEIELSAAQLYRTTPYPDLAGMAVCHEQRLKEHFYSNGLGWCAKTSNSIVAGFVIAHPRENILHIDELSVHADYQRQGIGSALLLHLIAQAKQKNFDAVSLTTYSDIAWNGPFYHRYGFVSFCETERPSWLSDLLNKEIRSGASASTRIAMMLDLV
ncbi:MAG: GNAT family N-acetyltransferase [Cohaesibacter sp.]|nr:GNAT family N-acetyltransferase [Cohaesibacter sp.]